MYEDINLTKNDSREAMAGNCLSLKGEPFERSFSSRFLLQAQTPTRNFILSIILFLYIKREYKKKLRPCESGLVMFIPPRHLDVGGKCL